MTARTTLKATLLTAIVAAIPTFASGAELREAPGAVLAAWAEAYSARQGARMTELYTPDARIWDGAGREQLVGQAAILSHYDHHGLEKAGIEVRFGHLGLREVAPGVAVASGDRTCLTEQ
jgi:ketosteroid isomerase-like protein